jgi:LacI family transcriptional regulator
MALADAEVADALRFIWNQGHRPIRVTDILRQVPVSRRSLERRFRKLLRRSLLQEIRRVHVARAKDLLAKTDLSMDIVAERSGFPGAARLSTVFRQEVSLTPRAYRHQFRCGTSEEGT